VEDLLALLKGAKNESLWNAFTAWINHSILRRLVPNEPSPELHDIEEVAAMVNQGVITWSER
jgi:hypothetical protein